MEKGYLSENIVLDKCIYVVVLLVIILMVECSGIIGSCIMERNIVGQKKLSIKWFYVGLAYLLYIFFSVNRKIAYGYGGTDIYGYFLNFENARGQNLFRYILERDVEFGYSLLEWIISNIFRDFRIHLLLFHSICFWCLIKYCSNLYIKKIKFLLLFALFFNLLDVFNTLRNTTAVCLFMVILVELDRKKYWKAMLLTVFTISIHISAIIIIPVIAINIVTDLRKRKLKRRFIILLGFGICMAFFIVPIVVHMAENNGKYYVYGKSGVAYPVYAITLFSFIVSLKVVNKITKYSCINKTLIISLPICLLVMPLQQQYGVLYRMTLYFMPVLLGLYSSIIAVYRKKGIEGCFIIVILVAYLFVRVYKLLNINIYDVGLPYMFSLK